MTLVRNLERLWNKDSTSDGAKRKVAVIPTGEIIDYYGRLLAYIAPYFKGSESDPLPPPDDPRRRTTTIRTTTT